MAATLKSVKINKYKAIKDLLSNQIQRGHLAPGQKIPTEQELSKQFDVSRLTVRQALGELINENMIRSVQGKGTFVTEQQQRAPQALRTIHMLNCFRHESPEHEGFTGPLVSWLSADATRRGFSLCLSALPRHMTLGDFLHSGGIPPTFHGGVICAVPTEAETLARLREANIPHVVLPWQPGDIAAPRVGTESRAKIRRCLDTLSAYGHRRIGLVNCPADFLDFGILFEAWQQAARNAGEAPDTRRVVTASPWNEEDGAAAIRRLLDSAPEVTAVVLYGDRIAAGATRELLRLGKRIPNDLSLVVFDRYPWLDSVFPFRLSGAQQNLSGIAHTLLDVLEGQRESGVIEPVERLVPADWIDGDTTALV